MNSPTSTNKYCPNCGTPIPTGSPGGLCPQCLMNAGLESGQGYDPQVAATLARQQSTPRPTPPGGFTPPEISELAAKFPQLEILELLGKGGMGAVYKARQRGLDRLVAVKILPPEIGNDPAFAERFAREARALGKLNHPNIVSVYDFGQSEDSAGGLYYFLMEYVEGANLRQAIRSGGMTAKEALAIIPQICDALQFAHDEGIVHRDIKPENILIDKRGRVKIADFGLAKLLGADQSDHALTGTNQVMGTLRYMAPEQMLGAKEIDHRADIFSLGVVFYELLTGELPVGRFAPPSKTIGVDVRLDEVVLRALEREPTLRYQQASEVKTQVQAIADAARRSAQAKENQPAALEHIKQQITQLGSMLVLLGLIMMFIWVPFVAALAWFATQEIVERLLPAISLMFVYSLIAGAIVTRAGFGLRRAEGLGFGLVGLVLAMLPFSPVAIFAIPWAFWAWPILTQRDADVVAEKSVRDRFIAERKRQRDQQSVWYDLGYIFGYFLRDNTVRWIIGGLAAVVYLACLVMFFSFHGERVTLAGVPTQRFSAGQPGPWLLIEASARGHRWSIQILCWANLVALIGIGTLQLARQIERLQSGKMHSMVWHYAIWGFMLVIVCGLGATNLIMPPSNNPERVQPERTTDATTGPMPAAVLKAEKE